MFNIPKYNILEINQKERYMIVKNEFPSEASRIAENLKMTGVKIQLMDKKKYKILF
jgi:hypothetical protein